MEYTRLAVLIWCLHIGLTVGAGDVQLGCDVKETRRKSQVCCFSRGKRLPGITSDREFQIIMTEMERNQYNSVWLDLKRKRLSTWHWVDGSPMEIKPGHSRGHCAYIDILTTVVSHTICSDQSRGYMCQVKDCSSCRTLTQDSHYCEQHSGSCFLFYCNKMNWPNARNKCQKRGYDLAITNKTVFSPDKQFYQECRSLWVGGYRDIWTGQEGPERTFGLWGDRQPSNQGDCSIFKRHGDEFLIHSEYCTNQHFSLCYGTHNGTNNQSANYGLYSSESPTQSTNKSHQTLSVIIGVVIGVCLVCTVTALCIYRRYRKKIKNKEELDQQELPNRSVSEPLIDGQEADQDHRTRNGDQIEIPRTADESSPSNFLPRNRSFSDPMSVEVYQGKYEMQTNTRDNSILKRTVSDQLYSIPEDDIPKIVADSIRKKYAKVEVNILESEVAPKDLTAIFTPLLLYDCEGRKQLDNYTQIFDVKDKPVRIFLWGELGQGKTTLIKQILNDWIEAVQEKNHSKMHFSLVIPIFLRRVKAKTFNEVLEDQLSLSSDEVANVLKYVKRNPKDTLYLCDGYDEFDSKVCADIDKIVKGKTSTKANILVTARTRRCFNFDNTSENPNITVEIRGFPETSAERFVFKYFKEENDAKGCMQSIKERNFTQLTKSPFLLSLMCLIYGRDHSLATDITCFYQDLIAFVCVHYERKHLKSEDRTHQDDILDKYQKDLMVLGKFAADVLMDEQLKLTFQAQYVIKRCKRALKFGLLGRYEDICETGCVTFLHKHIFEFIAAFYISKLNKIEKVACLKGLHRGALGELEHFVEFLKTLDSKETASQVQSIIAGKTDNISN